MTETGSGRAARVACALDRLAPHIPKFERQAVLDHALHAPGLAKAAPEQAAWLSMTAFIRHALTDYESLLKDGYDQASARHFVADRMQGVLRAWGCRRRLDDNAPPQSSPQSSPRS